MGETALIHPKEVEKRVIPVTKLRRNLGEVLKTLPGGGPIFITKGSSVVAEIHPRAKGEPRSKKKTTAEKLMKFVGMWEGTKLNGDKLWKEVLIRDSKAPIKL